MARCSKVILAAAIFLQCLCGAALWAEDESRLVAQYGFIGLPDGRPILLRYSAIEDVMSALGAPDEEKHFAKGGEDFFWTDFWIYSYKSGNLSFYFESKRRRIIRIVANTAMLDGFSFPFGLDAGLETATILDRIRRSPGVVSAGVYRGDVSYGLDNVPEFSGSVLSLSPRERHYDVYYGAPWKEDSAK